MERLCSGSFDRVPLDLVTPEADGPGVCASKAAARPALASRMISVTCALLAPTGTEVVRRTGRPLPEKRLRA